jgi:hypothetical protein
MIQKKKSTEELQQEVQELEKRANVILKKYRASKRKPANMVGIALIITGVVAWNCWEFYHGRNPWHNFFEPSQWDISKRRSLIEIGIVVILLAYGLVDSFVRSRKQKQDMKAEADWYRSLDAAVDINDYEDQDCLYDFLEPEEREQLIRELQRMPKGSRSLHKAVEIVDPELIDDPVA